MTAEQFAYWLQGFMEIANPDSLTRRETQILKDHLNLVFSKKTPERSEGKEVDLGVPEYINPPEINLNPFESLDTQRFCSPSNSTSDPNLICNSWVTTPSLSPNKKLDKEKKGFPIKKDSGIKC